MFFFVDVLRCAVLELGISFPSVRLVRTLIHSFSGIEIVSSRRFFFRERHPSGRF